MWGRVRSLFQRRPSAAQVPLADESAADAAERANLTATTTATPGLATAYYPSWSSWSRPPESLDFSKFDILFYAFATPSQSHQLNWDEGSTAILTRLVAAAKNSGRGTKIVLSVGGWGGCQYFSDTMSSSANRGTFITALKNAVTTYGLDGVDIDWEYPNSAGAGQPYSAQDSANLLTFFTYLRKSLGTSKIISAAVPDSPWLGANGRSLSDVSAYAAQMNYVNIMNYDVWGASATPGPNAPLADGCKTSTQPNANATAAVQSWSSAGFPKNKILLGLPLYGYVSKSAKTVLVGMASKPSRVADTDTQAASKAPGVAGAATDDAAEPAPSSPLPTKIAGTAGDMQGQGPFYDPNGAYFLNGVHDRGAQKLAAIIAAPAQAPETAVETPKIKKRWSLSVGGSRAKAADEAKKAADEAKAPNGDGTPSGEAPKATDAAASEAPAPEAPAQDDREGAKVAERAVERVATPKAQAVSGDLSTLFGQQIAFSDILAKGALAKSGTSYVAANGYTRAWDGCSSTPYLYNQSRSTVITYDDPQSLATKAAFARAQGLAGCFTWSLDQDDGYNLQNSIRTALGK